MLAKLSGASNLGIVFKQTGPKDWSERLFPENLVDRSGFTMVRSERSQLAAIGLISFGFFDFTASAYPSLCLRLYPSAETRQQSSIAEHCRHDKSSLKVAPIASSAQSTCSLVITSGGAMRIVCS